MKIWAWRLGVAGKAHSVLGFCLVSTISEHSNTYYLILKLPSSCFKDAIRYTDTSFMTRVLWKCFITWYLIYQTVIQQIHNNYITNKLALGFSVKFWVFYNRPILSDRPPYWPLSATIGEAKFPLFIVPASTATNLHLFQNICT